MLCCRGVKNLWSKIGTFFLTFSSYAYYHAVRKAFSNVKSTLIEQWTPTNGTVTVEPRNIWEKDNPLFATHDEAEHFLGVLDSVFMLSYAIGLFISGPLGTRYGPSRVLMIGMLCAGISVIAFGFVPQQKELYGFLWVLNGFFQSFGWPNTVAIMNNWFGKNRRGLIFGFWSSCASFGNIIGALLVAQVLSYGFQYAFLVVSTMLIAGVIVNIFGLIAHPHDIGLKENEEAPLLASDVEEDGGPSSIQDEELPSEEVVVDGGTLPLLDRESRGCCNIARSYFKSFWQWKVILYSSAYFFLKLVNYSFFFWLPLYLKNKFHWTEDRSDIYSTMYDVGGILGGIILGYVSDRMRHRSLVLLPCLLMGAGFLFAYYFVPDVSTPAVNMTLMTFNGIFIGGVACLISAAVCADLGKSTGGRTSDTGMITGIIDGFGSLGAAVGQLFVPQLHTALGWASVFYFFIICTMLTAVSLVPMFISDVRDICRRRRR